MKIALSTIMSFCVVATALAQEVPVQPPAAQPPMTPAPTAPPAEPVKSVDPEEVKQAEALMVEVAKVYKDAKAIADVLTLKIEMPKMPGQEDMPAQEQKLTLTIGAGEDAVMAMPGFTMTIVDGKLHLVSENVSDKFFVTPLEPNLEATLEKHFGDSLPSPPHVVLRSDAPLAKKLGSLTLNAIGDVELTGYKTGTLEDGSASHEISFNSSRGKGTASIADATKLVRTVQFQMEPAPGMVVTGTVTMDPQISESLTQPIAFSAGDRKAVATIDELQPTPIKVGDVAPDFDLAQLDSEKTVKLSDLQGSVVVLDFWATWCGPCKRALPMLQEFATWAEKETGGSVKVFAVNVWERSKTLEDRKKLVTEFWKTAKYTIPLLFDLDDKTIGKYGFNGIPATVVVGTDGKISAIHNGFTETMVADLKKDVEAAKKAG